MATVRTRVYLQERFATGQRPTGEDFADLIASFLAPGEEAAPHESWIALNLQVTGTATPVTLGRFVWPAFSGGSLQISMLSGATGADIDVMLTDGAGTTFFGGIALKDDLSNHPLTVIDAVPSAGQVMYVVMNAADGFVLTLDGIRLIFTNP